MILNKVNFKVFFVALCAASIVFSSNSALAFEILESKVEVLETFLGSELVAKTFIDFEVVKVKGVPTYSCDNHPDDPICEFYNFYYDNASYSYIKTKKQTGFIDDFYPLDGSIDEVTWQDAVNGNGLEDGVVILYKTSGDPISYKQLAGFLKKTAEKYIK